jgi:YD repeat-containing protein
MISTMSRPRLRPRGTISYTSDAIGTRQTMTVGGQPQVSYSYDAGDRVTQITQGASSVQFGYDSLGRRTSMLLPNGVLTSYAYDESATLRPNPQLRVGYDQARAVYDERLRAMYGSNVWEDAPTSHE